MGCMRLCPGHSYRLSHKQFYTECLLKKAVWPGRDTATWNFRWKAKDATDNIVLEGTDEYEAHLKFSRDEDGSLKMDGKMVVGGYKLRKFSGLKTGESSLQEDNDSGWVVEHSIEGSI